MRAFVVDENSKQLKTYPDSISLSKDLKDLQHDYFFDGFLRCQITAESSEDTIGTYFINKDEKFRFENIIMSRNSSFKYARKQHINTVKELFKEQKEIITNFENNGHPFAVSQFSLDSSKGNKIYGALNISKGPRIIIDSIILTGDTDIKLKYIENYIGIEAGDPYNEKKIRSIYNRMSEIPFLKTTRKPQVIFTKDATKLFLFADKRKSNRFSGILGVLTDERTSKVTITGDAKIDLKNAFKGGEEISFNWRKLQSLTQDLDSRLSIPFLFNSSFGVEGEFKLFKKDTTFLELNQLLGIQYILKGNNKITTYFDNYSSSLINTDQYQNATVLPSFADVKYQQYGIKTSFSKLDYQINPSSGYDFLADLSGGIKTIAKNPDLSEALYNNIELRSTQYRAKITARYFQKIAKRQTLMLKVNASHLENDNLFRNELYRIGGLRTIRGFDEESVRASTYGIGTLEYRFLLEQNSNLYAFFDYGHVEEKINSLITKTQLMSVGAGISFQTKPGIFSLNYAVGSTDGGPFLLRSAKIHFGFVNYF